MAFGALLRTAAANGGSILATNNVTVTSIAVAVGDLVFVTIYQQTALTASGASDNLGNTYVATNAGTDNGATTGRSFYSRITVAGNITQVSVTATGSANDFSIAVAIFEGPFPAPPIDANPANTQDNASPHTCPATGVLAQSDELVIVWACFNPDAVWSATSPNLKAVQATSSGNGNCVIGYQVVAATTSIAPEFTSTGASVSVIGTSSFMKAAAAATAFPFRTDPMRNHLVRAGRRHWERRRSGIVVPKSTLWLPRAA